jgi:transaldolase
LNDINVDGMDLINDIRTVNHPLTANGLETFMADWAKTGQKIG